MAVKRGIAIAGQLVPNVTGSLYSVTTGDATRGVITAAVGYANAAVSNAEFYIVPPGGSADTSNRVLRKSFAIDEEYTFPELIGQSVSATGSLDGNDGGNGGAGLNIVLTVTEFTGDS